MMLDEGDGRVVIDVVIECVCVRMYVSEREPARQKEKEEEKE